MRLIGKLLAAVVLSTVASVVTAQETADDFYEDARRLETRGDLRAAIIQLKNALQQDNQHVPSLVLYAELLARTDDVNGAADAFSDSLLLGADPNYVVPKLADIYLRQQRYRRILDELAPEAVTGSARAELLGFHALAHTQLREGDEAAARVSQALQIDPLARTPAMAQTGIYINQGNIAAALELSEELAVRFPDDAAVWFLRASILVGVREFDAALEAFDDALSVDEALLTARLGRTELLLAQEELRAAEADINYLQKTYPEEPRAAFLAAQLHQMNGEMEQALEGYTTAANIIARIDESVVASNQQLTIVAAESNIAIGADALAIVALQNYQERHPEDQKTGIMLVDLLLKQRAGGAAVRVLDTLLQSAPGSLRLRARKAEAQAMRGAHTDAIALWKGLKDDGVVTPEIDAAIARSQILSGELSEGAAGLEALLRADPDRATERYMLADTYLNAGRLPNAMPHIEKLLDFNPGNPAYLGLMGKALAQMGNREDAARFYERALEIGPSDEESELRLRLELIGLAIEEGDFEEARRTLDTLAESHPDSAAVMRERARTEFESGETEEAQRWIERAVLSDSTDLPTARLAVEIQLEQQSLGSAVETARNFAKRSSRSLEAQFFFAQTLARVGETEAALAQYKLISRRPDIPDEQLYRVASAQQRLGDLSGASAVLFAAMRAAPEVTIYREASIDILIRMGEYEQALEQATALSGEYPTAVSPIILSARAHMGLGQYRDAAAAYGRAQAMAPASSDVLVGWQRALVMSGEAEKAEDLLSKWLEEKPDDAAIRFTYGGLMLHLDRLPEARDQFSRLVAEGTENPLVLNNLAYVQNELGDPGALETARRAHAMAPQMPEVNDTLGWILVTREQLEEALPYLREAVARRSNDAALRYHLGSALSQLGREREARSQLEAALNMPADDTQRAEIEALLATLP